MLSDTTKWNDNTIKSGTWQNKEVVASIIATTTTKFSPNSELLHNYATLFIIKGTLHDYVEYCAK